MNRHITGAVCALVAAAIGSNTHAEILGGGVTGGNSGGAFVEISPPSAVGPDVLESPDLVGFDEAQGVVLTDPLPVRPGVVLGVGSEVSSHYVFFDPDNPGTLAGFVDFDEPIIGFISGPDALDATSLLFGAPGVSYSAAPAIGPDTMDQFSVAPGMPNRLLVQYGANSPGDHLRVLTGTVVPEPAALLLGGLATAGVVLRRE